MSGEIRTTHTANQPRYDKEGVEIEVSRSGQVIGFNTV